jgi:hypothetical protein
LLAVDLNAIDLNKERMQTNPQGAEAKPIQPWPSKMRLKYFRREWNYITLGLL